MNRRTLLRAAGISMLGVTALLDTQTESLAAPSAALYKACADACAACAKACNTCSKHCAEMVKAGMNQHQKSLNLSLDCMDICNATDKIVRRKSGFSMEMVRVCIAACKACGTECGKYKEMAEMAKCAAACAACEKACNALLKG